MLKRFGLLALTLFLCTPAHSETGDGLLQACEALERGVRILGDNIQLPARADAHKCWGYMGAVQDFSTIVVDNKTGKPLFNSCPGPDTTLTQLIRVFTNYARTHPQELPKYTLHAIEHLNQARELLERTAEADLMDAADEIGPILLALEDWQRGKQSCAADQCSISYEFTNTPLLPTPITEGNSAHDRHIANNRKPNTAKAIAQLSLQSEGVSD